jgi:hypothetical protein
LAATYVGWQWQAGQGTTSSNTAGSITSTVSVNASAGFSIVTFAVPSSGTTGTVGHGLGVTPAFIVAKGRGASDNWVVWHKSATTTVDQYLRLNTSDAVTSTTGAWGSAVPNSTTFGLKSGTLLADSQNAVAYCWSEIAGFSKFGSYTGNGSTDGTFVYTGFRPKFVMFKRTDSTGNWVIFDTSRSTSNQVSKYLIANSSGAEGDDGTISGSWQVDYLSNGFKLKATGESTVNPNGATIAYVAFAENPFKNSLAR